MEDISHPDTGDVPEEHQSPNDEEEEQIVSSQVLPDTDNSYAREEQTPAGVEPAEDPMNDDHKLDEQVDYVMDGGFTQDILEQRERTIALGRRLSVRYEHDFEDDQDQDDAFHTGPETQMLLQEREQVIETGKRAMVSRVPSFGSWAHTSHSVDRVPTAFKGKGKARQQDMEVDFPMAVHGVPGPSRSDMSTSPRDPGYHQSPPRHERNGASTRSKLPITSPAQSQEGIMVNADEDSDDHFSGLDSVITRALRRLATRYRFSASEVRQKYELHHQDLAAAKMALESNRRILDEDTLFQDDFI